MLELQEPSLLKVWLLILFWILIGIQKIGLLPIFEVRQKEEERLVEIEKKTLHHFANVIKEASDLILFNVN